MKTKIIIGVGMAVSFVAGGVAGYFLRKSREVQFVECTEEELQQYAEENGYSSDSEDASPAMTESNKDGANTVDSRKIDYTNYWKQQKELVKEVKEQIDGVYNRTSEPGEPEDLTVKDTELDPDFQDAIEDTEDIHGADIVESSGSEFYEDEPESTKVTVFWYEKDDVVTTLSGEDEDMTNEVVVEDPVEEFRFDIRKEFDECRPDELDSFGEGSVLYRKNKHMNILYQIIRYPSSYAKRKAQEEFGYGPHGMQPD